jgi:hypothetical protein
METQYKTPKSYLLKVLHPLIPREAYQENTYWRQESIMVSSVSFYVILETVMLIMPSCIYPLNIIHAK